MNLLDFTNVIKEHKEEIFEEPFEDVINVSSTICLTNKEEYPYYEMILNQHTDGIVDVYVYKMTRDVLQNGTFGYGSLLWSSASFTQKEFGCLFTYDHIKERVTEGINSSKKLTYSEKFSKKEWLFRRFWLFGAMIKKIFNRKG